MSESEPSTVFLFDGDDPEMRRAGERARETFRYFWREVAWERRRIVPALDLECVKAPFSDGVRTNPATGHPEVEQMWITDVDFDGRDVSGELLNSPNWLTSVKQGDAIRIPLGQISDWMYAIEGEVYGAYTVQLLRSRMDEGERAEHDEAWGLEFGDPEVVRLIPTEKPARGGLLKGLFGKRQPAAAAGGLPTGDHPMSVNMGPSLRDKIASDPGFMNDPDDRGWTLLHHLALAGSTTGVQVLLEAGANVNAVTTTGLTAADLARALGWDEVVALLERG
jgi:uncharacterized protein YegJ (DUF2314 family)